MFSVYLFMCMCLSIFVWCHIEDALSVIAMRVTADKTHTHGALGDFAETVEDLKTRLN